MYDLHEGWGWICELPRDYTGLKYRCNFVCSVEKLMVLMFWTFVLLKKITFFEVCWFLDGCTWCWVFDFIAASLPTHICSVNSNFHFCLPLGNFSNDLYFSDVLVYSQDGHSNSESIHRNTSTSSICKKKEPSQRTTLWKIKGWNPKSGRFGSDDFCGFQFSAILRFHMLISFLSVFLQTFLPSNGLYPSPSSPTGPIGSFGQSHARPRKNGTTEIGATWFSAIKLARKNGTLEWQHRSWWSKFLLDQLGLDQVLFDSDSSLNPVFIGWSQKNKPVHVLTDSREWSC